MKLTSVLTTETQRGNLRVRTTSTLLNSEFKTSLLNVVSNLYDLQMFSASDLCGAVERALLLVFLMCLFLCVISVSVRRRLSVQLPILHHSYLPVVGGVSSSSSSLFGSREAFVHHDLLMTTTTSCPPDGGIHLEPRHC